MELQHPKNPHGESLGAVVTDPSAATIALAVATTAAAVHHVHHVAILTTMIGPPHATSPEVTLATVKTVNLAASSHGATTTPKSPLVEAAAKKAATRKTQSTRPPRPTPESAPLRKTNVVPASSKAKSTSPQASPPSPPSTPPTVYIAPWKRATNVTTKSPREK